MDNNIRILADGLETDFEIRAEQAIVTSRIAAVEIELKLHGLSYYFTGEALRQPGDRFDKEVALKLAYGRALEKAAHRLLRQGTGKVKHNDDVAALRLVKRPKHPPLPTTAEVKLIEAPAKEKPKVPFDALASAKAGQERRKAIRAAKKAKTTTSG